MKLYTVCDLFLKINNFNPNYLGAEGHRQGECDFIYLFILGGGGI